MEGAWIPASPHESLPANQDPLLELLHECEASSHYGTPLRDALLASVVSLALNDRVIQNISQTSQLPTIIVPTLDYFLLFLLVKSFPLWVVYVLLEPQLS